MNNEHLFWSKVDMGSGSGDCWLWQASTRNGYGNVRINGVTHYSHRVAYELVKGKVPDGMILDHLCHSNDPTCSGGRCTHRLCVNPDHLEPTTQPENKARGRSGLHNRIKTHCPYGHEYTVENTYTWSDGRRGCKTCRRTIHQRKKL